MAFLFRQRNDILPLRKRSAEKNRQTCDHIHCILLHTTLHQPHNSVQCIIQKMRIYLCLDQLQLRHMLYLLLLTHILKKPFNPSCHLSGTGIKLLDFNTVGRYCINSFVLSFSNLLNIMENFRNRFGNAVCQTERTPQQNSRSNQNRRTHSDDRQTYISSQLRLYLHQFRRLLINIILHFFLKERGQDFCIICHKFLSFLIILYLKKLIHPFLKILQIVSQIFQRTQAFLL